MKFRIPNNLNQNVPTILRKAGYFRIFDRISGHESFVHKLTGQHYPRFHLYIRENPEEVVFDLHLDQAATRYSGQKAHKADYESEEVKQELTKIYHVVNQYTRQNDKS